MTQVIEKVLEVMAAEAETPKTEQVARAMVTIVAMVQISVETAKEAGAAKGLEVVVARAVRAAVQGTRSDLLRFARIESFRRAAGSCRTNVPVHPQS